MATLQEKPIIVAAAFPSSGHSKDLIHILNHLTRKGGYKIYAILGRDSEPALSQHHPGNEITFIHHPWDGQWPGRDQPPPGSDIAGLQLFAYIWNHIFYDAIPYAFQALHSTLERVRQENGPHRKVVILSEVLFSGLIPYLHGAPLPEGYDSLPPVIGFHTSIDSSTNYEVPPFGAGMPYDPTPENLAMWKMGWDGIASVGGEMRDHINTIIKPLGAKTEYTGLSITNTFDPKYGGDPIFLFTTPSAEYPPRTAKKSNVRYVGALPKQPLKESLKYPEWWDGLVVANSKLPAGDKKKVIFVSQGTVHLDYDDLVIPSLKAFGNRQDVIIIAVLGVKGGKLTSETDPAYVVPESGNAKVLDYFPYDAILPYADVFITNAGYNGFIHGITNGVPMVMAGMVADKGDVAARAEWAGVAVNLRTQRATEGALLEAVDKIVGDEKYRKKAEEMKKENERMDPLGEVESAILAAASK